jgi:hypothetical protein
MVQFAEQAMAPPIVPADGGLAHRLVPQVLSESSWGNLPEADTAWRGATWFGSNARNYQLLEPFASQSALSPEEAAVSEIFGGHLILEGSFGFDIVSPGLSRPVAANVTEVTPEYVAVVEPSTGVFGVGRDREAAEEQLVRSMRAHLTLLEEAPLLDRESQRVRNTLRDLVRL